MNNIKVFVTKLMRHRSATQIMSCCRFFRPTKCSPVFWKFMEGLRSRGQNLTLGKQAWYFKPGVLSPSSENTVKTEDTICCLPMTGHRSGSDFFPVANLHFVLGAFANLARIPAFSETWKKKIFNFVTEAECST